MSFKIVQPSESVKSLSEEDTIQPIDTVSFFSGNDIAWYNVTTKELKFKESFRGLTFPLWGFCDLLILSDDILLFSINLILTNNFSSIAFAAPCLYIEFDDDRIRYILGKGYPDVDAVRSLGYDLDSSWAEHIEACERNWKPIEQSWNLFIQQLKKEGKYRK